DLPSFPTRRSSDLLQHLRETAHLLAGLHRGDIELGKLLRMLRQRVGKRCAVPNTLMHSTQDGLKGGTPCPVNQEIPGLENRKPGLDEGQKLLVEDQKVLARYSAATPPSGIQDWDTPAAAQSKEEQAALFQLCANR